MVKLQNKDILTLQDGRTATDLCMMICSYMSSNGFYMILLLICTSNDLIERLGISTLLDIIKDFMEQGYLVIHISSVFRTIVSFIAIITFPNTYGWGWSNFECKRLQRLFSQLMIVNWGWMGGQNMGKSCQRKL